MNECYVYHAAREQDYGDYSKGYIGVSIDPSRRKKEHYNSSYNPHFRAALDKYPDIDWTVIFEGTEEECYTLEEKLRPVEQMGWNITKGGSKPPSRKGCSLSDIRI